jgi:hypothetical protein
MGGHLTLDHRVDGSIPFGLANSPSGTRMLRSVRRHWFPSGDTGRVSLQPDRGFSPMRRFGGCLVGWLNIGGNTSISEARFSRKSTMLLRHTRSA